VHGLDSPLDTPPVIELVTCKEGMTTACPNEEKSGSTQLNKKITKHYDKLNIEAQKRIRALSLSDLCDSSEHYPCLKHQKANTIRHFAPVAESLAEEHSVPGNKASQHRLAVAKKLTGLHQLLECKWQDWPKKHQVFVREVENMMHHYFWLAADAMVSGKHLWSLVQKSHLILHLASQSSMQPRLSWTYGSESFMGSMVQMAASCTSGTPGHKVPEKVCQKFRLLFHLS
jgi:hypothetical protein